MGGARAGLSIDASAAAGSSVIDFCLGRVASSSASAAAAPTGGAAAPGARDRVRVEIGDRARGIGIPSPAPSFAALCSAALRSAMEPIPWDTGLMKVRAFVSCSVGRQPTASA